MADALPIARRHDGRQHILADASAGAITPAWFDPAFWSAAVPAAGGRGNAWFVDGAPSGTTRYVLRQYLRGGKAAAISRDRYVFTGLARTRSFAEWTLLRELYLAGLPVPRPVAALVSRGRLTYRAALITCAIDGASSLGARAQKGAISESELRAVGACIRRFHDAGVWHADLNANNVLFDAQGRVVLIDFDRGRRRSDRGWRAANLARLRRSLDKLTRRAGGDGFDEQQWAALCAAYADDGGAAA